MKSSVDFNLLKGKSVFILIMLKVTMLSLTIHINLIFSSKFADISGNNVLSLGDHEAGGSGAGHQLELFSISTKTKPIKSKRSLNISDEHGDSIEIFGARFVETEESATRCDVIYGVIGALRWEEVDVDSKVNLERNVVEKKVSTSGAIDTSDYRGNGKRLTGEGASRRKRVESINESEMTMAERLGESFGHNCVGYL